MDGTYNFDDGSLTAIDAVPSATFDGWQFGVTSGTTGFANLSVDDGFTFMNQSGGRTIVANYSAAPGVQSFYVKSADGSDFQLKSFDVSNVEDIGATSFTIAGYRDGALVVAAEAVDLTISDSAGNVSYSYQAGDGSGYWGKLSFNAAFNNVDEIRILFPGDALLAVDNLVVSAVTPPEITAISRAGGASATTPASASTLDYTVTFDQAVTGVDASDFTLTATGTADGSIASVSGSGTTYTVTVNAISGDGTLRLDLNGSGTGIKSGASVDIAGGYTAGQTYTLDHTSPNAPSTPDMTAGSDTGSSNSDNLTKTTTPTFTGTAEAGATVTLYDTDGTTVLGTTTATGGTWSITTSTLAAGDHTLSAKATDAAGNVSSASSGLAVAIDTTAPTGLQLGATTVTSSTATSGSTLTTLSATDAHAVTYSLAIGNGTNDADNGSFSISGSSLKAGGSSLSAGTYKIYTAATDAAGNVANQAFTITVVDAPEITSITRAGGASATTPASAATVAYTVTFDQAVTGVDLSDFTLTSTGTADGSIASISGSGATYTVTVNTISGDGTLRLDLKGSGTGIESGASVGVVGGYTGGQTYTLDHTSPNAPSTPDMTSGSDTGASNSDNLTKTTTPTFTGTAEAGATVTLYDTDGTTALGTGTATGGTWSITTSTLSAGGHTLTAKATDAAGNVSAASSGLAVTVDTTAPTLAITSDVTSLKAGETATITFTFSEDPGATFTWDGSSGDIAVSGGTLSALSGSGLTRAAIFTPTASTNGGTASITVAAGSYTDAAGNNGGAGTTPSLSFDTLAPSAPSAPDLAAGSDTGASNADNVTANTTPTFTGTAETGSTVTLYDTDGTTVLGTGTAAGGTWSITSSALAEGSHTLTAKTADGAGNVSAASAGLAVTIDATAPTLAITSDVASLKAGETATITFTFSEDPGTTFDAGDVVVSGGTLGAVSGSGTTRTAVFTPTPDVDSGATSITVAAASYTDAAGNSGGAGTTPSLSYDTLAPGAPSAPALASASDTGASNADGVTSDATPTVTGTAEAGSTVTLYDTDGTTVLGSTTATGGTWSITPSSALAEGAHTLTAKAVDAAGNASTAGAGLTVTIDTTPPAAPSAPDLAAASDTGASNTDDVTTATTPTFTGTAAAGSTVTLYDTDGTTVLGSATADGAGDWSITASTLSAGVHTVTAKAADAAGNLSPASAGLAVTIEAPPPPPSSSPPTQTATVDGVQVETSTVSNSDGSQSQLITIPVVAPGRQDQVGGAGVADIPLIVSGGAELLGVQVPTGLGLQAVGPASPSTAGARLTDLLREIQSHTTPGSDDQSQLTGSGAGFVDGLAADTPLLIQSLTPTVNAGSPPEGPLVISGAAGAPGQPATALVIDTTGLPPGQIIQLDNVDFAAIIGAAHVTGGAGSQSALGDSASQYIYLGADDDTLHGGGGVDTVGSAGGDDQVYGDDGDDFVFGGIGDDQVLGGRGGDMVHGNAGADLVNGNEGADTVYGGKGDDTAYGGKDDDLVFGDLGDDRVYGDLGDDQVNGNMGADTVSGGDGADTVRGGQDNDSVSGDAGNDQVWGDLGDDTLAGGAGADLFAFRGGDGADRITDFSHADGDRIAYSGGIAAGAWTVSAAGADAVITFAAGGSVTLVGVSAGAVTADWFVGV